MSNILKRPMFKKGGNVGQGIMNKVERKMYNQGTTLEELAKADATAKQALDYSKLYQAAYGPENYDDVISNLLIRGGMNLITGTGEDQGLLRETVSAFREPTTAAMQAVAKKKAVLPQARVLGVQSAIQGKLAKDLQAIKSGKGYESSTTAAQIKDLQGYFKGVNTTKASALKMNNLIPNIQRGRDAYGSKFYGVVDPNETGAKELLAKLPDGTIVLHYDFNRFYQMKDGVPVAIGTK
jgi:hypothetical protein